MSLTALALVFGIGALIGAVGIGGFLLVPVLVFIEGHPIRDAVIASTVSFAGLGLVSLFTWIRQRNAPPGGSKSFLVATAPGALVGALLLRSVSSATIGVFIAAAVGLAGLLELFGLPKPTAQAARPFQRAIIGAVSGVGSALTGTSGPLIAMPLLAWTGVPIVNRIRISQVAQFPIAATAAMVFIGAGDIPLTFAATSALALACGSLVGTRLTGIFSPTVLRRVSAALMLITAFSMLASTFS